MNYFDLHCDTPYECFIKQKEFYVNPFAVSGQRGSFFSKWHQVFAVWIRDDLEMPWQFYNAVIKDFKEKLKTAPENLTPVFSVEGGALIEKDLERLYILKKDEISFLTLTWNGENPIAGGVDSDKGLTPLGKEAIKIMNSLKMGCDLSHINPKSFYEAVYISDYPLATHSNCFSICPHKRNLSDDKIKLIAEKGGLIGLCFYPQFLPNDVFEGIYRNICHLSELGLSENIAIGSDFDGGKMTESLDSIEKIPSLFSFLEQKGIEKTLLNKFFYENAYNFIAKLA